MAELKKHLALCASVIALGCAGNVCAAEATTSAANSAEPIEQVVVVGEKFGRTVQETAASVGIVTADDIEKSNMLEGRDAFERLVNVTTITDGRFAIRGVAFDNVTGAGFGALGTIYVDGVRLGDKSTRFGPDMLWDVKSMEVLRGAQSTLQGRNALAGSIRITSNDPSFDWQGKARAIVGNGNTQDYALALSGPLVKDKLAFRVTAERHKSDGFLSNPVLKTNKVDFADDWQFRGKLRFLPTDDITVRFTLNYADVKRRDALSDTRTLGEDGYNTANPNLGLAAETGVAGAGSLYRRVAYNNIPEFDHNKTTAGFLSVEYRLNDAVTLTSETELMSSQNKKQRDGDSAYFSYDYDGDTLSVSNPFGIRDGVDDDDVAVDPLKVQYEDDDNFSQELRAKYDDGGPFTILGGLYYTKEREKEDNFTVLIYRNVQDEVAEVAEAYGVSDTYSQYLASFYSDDVPLYVYSSEPVHVENYAAYAEAEYTLFDKLTFTAGFRYDHERNTSGIRTNGEILGLADADTVSAVSSELGELAEGINEELDVFTTGSQSATQSFSAFLPKFGVRYKLSEDYTVGATFQKAYRAGGVGTNVVRQIVTKIKPEYTTNYEIFLRGNMFGGRGHIEANAYLTNWKNQQVSVSLSDMEDDDMAANAGKSRLYGGEVQFGYQLTDAWKVYGGLGYSHSEFLKFNIVTPESISALGVSVSADAMASKEGNFFAGSPEWTGVLGLDWHSPSGWFANVNANFQGQSYANTSNSLKNDARALVNLRVGREFQHFTLSAYARNLLDEDYISDHVSKYQAVVGQPLTYGISLEVKM